MPLSDLNSIIDTLSFVAVRVWPIVSLSFLLTQQLVRNMRTMSLPVLRLLR